MARSEAKWQTVFNQYLREKRLHGYYELKQTDALSFPLSRLELHQYEGLQATENEGLVWKLSDEDRRKKPCDTLCIPPLPSFVVIKFPDAFYFIRIKDVVELVEKKAVSITQKWAQVVAQRILRV
jgi:penicillin-binding protein-related factor A (putative recombinase)